jgi:hypothetical protein
MLDGYGSPRPIAPLKSNGGIGASFVDGQTCASAPSHRTGLLQERSQRRNPASAAAAADSAHYRDDTGDSDSSSDDEAHWRIRSFRGLLFFYSRLWADLRNVQLPEGLENCGFSAIDVLKIEVPSARARPRSRCEAERAKEPTAT